MKAGAIFTIVVSLTPLLAPSAWAGEDGPAAVAAPAGSQGESSPFQGGGAPSKRSPRSSERLATASSKPAEEEGTPQRSGRVNKGRDLVPTAGSKTHPIPRKGKLPSATIETAAGAIRFLDAVNGAADPWDVVREVVAPASDSISAEAGKSKTSPLPAPGKGSEETDSPVVRPNDRAAAPETASGESMPPDSDSAGADKDAASAARRSYGEKLADASARFLGTPYVLDALGEGPGAADDDPLIRFDAVDCMTFVETCMAMAESSDASQVADRLSAIRYDQGEAALENRHHFFTAQWVPAQTASGRLVDITREVALKAGRPKSSVDQVKTVTQEQWDGRLHGRDFQLPPHRIPVGSFPFQAVPIGQVSEVLKGVPDGSLFALVREDRPLTPFLVTHVGFVVRHSGKTWFRHAGRDIYGQVIDEEAWHYLRRAMRYRKWLVTGMRFFRLQAPAAPSGMAQEK